MVLKNLFKKVDVFLIDINKKINDLLFIRILPY